MTNKTLSDKTIAEETELIYRIVDEIFTALAPLSSYGQQTALTIAVSLSEYRRTIRYLEKEGVPVLERPKV